MTVPSLLPPRNVWLPVAAGYPAFCAAHEIAYYRAFGLPLLTSPLEALGASMLWAFPAATFVAAAVMFADTAPARTRQPRGAAGWWFAAAALFAAPLAFASDPLDPRVAALHAVCLPGLALALVSLAVAVCGRTAAAPDGPARLRRAYLWAVLATVAAAAAFGAGRRDAAVDLARAPAARLVRADGDIVGIGILRITAAGVLYRTRGPDGGIRFAPWDDVRTLSWRR